jgi:alpha-galactosidase
MFFDGWPACVTLNLQSMSHTNNVSQKMISTNGRRAAIVMLLTSMVLFLALHETLPIMTTTTPASNEQTVTRTIKKETKTASSHNRYSSNQASVRVTKQQLPIYLLEPDTESVSQTTWGAIATEWNRTAKYTDLIHLAQPARGLPSVESGKRPVVMIHCGPKSGRCEIV